MTTITSVCDALIVPALSEDKVDAATVVDAVKTLQSLATLENMDAAFKEWYAKHDHLDPQAARIGYMAGRRDLLAA